MTPKQYRHMLKPWISKEILKKCDEKNKLLKIIKSESDPVILAPFRSQYKNLRNSITNEKRTNKKSNFAEKITENKNTSSKIWNSG